MTVVQTIRQSISKMGVKEIARRSGLPASTVSRVGSGQISPSYEVLEKISLAMGYSLSLQREDLNFKAPRLNSAKQLLILLRKELKVLGVKHAVIFGSVARKEDQAHSDVDIYLDFGNLKISASKILKAEGLVIEAFGKNKVDLVSQLFSEKGKKLKERIANEGVHVF